VVPDLQHDDRRQQPPIDQDRFDGCLRVAGEQCSESAVPDDHDHRSVVDVALRQGRRGIGIGRVDDLDRCGRVEVEVLAGPRERDGDRRRGGIGQQAVVGGILEGDARVQHGGDVEPMEDVQQAGDVVLVRVSQDEQVDPTFEERKVGAQPAQREVRVRPAVDQHRGAGRGLDEDRVALPDVEHGHVQTPIGPRGHRDHE
jgi:hypothetical protein